MQGVKLFQFAHDFGVTQHRVATVLGLTPPQVNVWARGKRPIPDAHLPVLVNLVVQAIDAAIAAIDAEPSSKLQEALYQDKARRKTAIQQRRQDFYMELLEDSGEGPTAMMTSSLIPLSKYIEMDPEDFLKGDTPAQMVEAGLRFVQAAKLLQRLQPFQGNVDRESSTQV